MKSWEKALRDYQLEKLQEQLSDAGFDPEAFDYVWSELNLTYFAHAEDLGLYIARYEFPGAHFQYGGLYFDREPLSLGYRSLLGEDVRLFHRFFPLYVRPLLGKGDDALVGIYLRSRWMPLGRMRKGKLQYKVWL